MENRKITNTAEFRRWVKVQVAGREMSQAELARQMQIPNTRISEALHGRRSGKKYIVPIIEQLGGDVEAFEEFLKIV